MHVVLYDLSAESVVSVSEGIAGFFASWPELEGPARYGIPAKVDDEVRRILASLREGDERSAACLLLSDLVMRVILLEGGGPPCAVAAFRRFQSRDALRSAARRFDLTGRETQVLGLVLRGMRAAEIARRLGLSETTVADYFKHLRAKSGAHTRSGMLAAMLGWGERGP